jgi:hypothetical protein
MAWAANVRAGTKPGLAAGESKDPVFGNRRAATLFSLASGSQRRHGLARSSGVS